MHPEQTHLLKKMTPGQKLRLALDLYNSARKLKAAGLRMQHKNWTEDQIQEKVKEIFLYART